MQIDLKERVVVVTGGSEGIGASIVQTVAECGAKVAVLSRDEADMRRVVDAVHRQGGDGIWHKTDVTQSDEVAAAMGAVVERFGRIDAVVANAGTNGTWAPVEEMTPEEWRSTIDVNLTGTFLTMHHAVPHLKRRGGSAVIISSVNGTRTFSNEGASAYAASKAGQYALAKMLALELAPFRVRVNIICPGAFDTGIHEKTEREDLESIETPMEFPEGDIPLTGGEMGNPREVADLTAFLLSDLAGHITGTPVWIDGGQSLLH